MAVIAVVVALLAAPLGFAQSDVAQTFSIDGNVKGTVAAGAVLDDEAVRIDYSVELGSGANNSDQVWLAGLAWNVEAAEAVAVRWLKAGGWLPVWRLQLAAPAGVLPEAYVDGSADGFEYIDFDVSVSRLGSYDASVAWDEADGLLSLRVSDRANGATLVAATVDGVHLERPLRPVAGLIGAASAGGFDVAGLSTSAAYEEFGPAVGMTRDFSWKLLVGDEEVSRARFEFFDLEAMSVELAWPDEPVSGEVRLSVVQGDAKTPLFARPWSEGVATVNLPPLRQLPAGESRLALEYVTDQAAHLLDEKPLRLIRNKLHVTYETYGRNGRLDPSAVADPLDPYPNLTGTVRVYGEQPLDGLRVELAALYTPSAVGNDLGNLDPQRSVVIPLASHVLTAAANEPVDFAFDATLPDEAGRVDLLLQAAEGEGEVYVSDQNASTAIMATPIIPAFPGAEGWGMYATGGRAGRVIRVTNLNDSGPGSLREALEASGPRTVVFDVSGTIDLKSPLLVRNPHLTIAGQTAPGDGITLKNYALLIQADQVIVRFIRVRPGDGSKTEMDAIEIRNAEHVILDHVTMSWGTDETFNNWHNGRNHTLQWSMVYEALHNSVHPKGAHGYAMSVGGNGLSLHHTLIANSPGRNPSLAGPVRMDFRNNVIYNWMHRSGDGGVSSINMVNNYYKSGPATQHSLRRRIVKVESPFGRYYVDGNYVEGFPEITLDNWNGGVDRDGDFDLERVRAQQPVGTPPVITHSAEEAYELVLAYSGAILPMRDAHDERVVQEVRSGEPAFDGIGVVDAPDDVGGYPELRSAEPLLDSDGDGIPDAWEIERGLDPLNPEDGATVADEVGYTYLETYLNELAEPAYPEGHLDEWRARYAR